MTINSNNTFDSNMKTLCKYAYDVTTEIVSDEEPTVEIRIPANKLAELVILPKEPCITIPSADEKATIVQKNKLFGMKDVRVYDDRAVVMYFDDDTYTKSVITNDDKTAGKFDVDVGICICLLRKLLGDDGKNRNFKHLINAVHKLMRIKETARKKEAEEKERIKTENILAKANEEARINANYDAMKCLIKNAINEAFEDRERGCMAKADDTQ